MSAGPFIRAQETSRHGNASPRLRAGLTTASSLAAGESAAPRIARIARAVVKLAAMGPHLAELAEGMTEQAQRQAASAAATAATMEELSIQLSRSVSELRGVSADVEAALATVNRIAEQTRLLSINASIEAARSGEQGRAFAVVAGEVQRLSDDTGGTTQLIATRVHEMRESLARVEALDGVAEAPTAASAHTFAAVGHQVHEMATSAGCQRDSAKQLAGCSRDVNATAEALLLLIGTFRFDAHHHAEAAVARLVSQLAGGGERRERIEQQLVCWLGDHPYFELVYLTDARGRQQVDNIRWQEGSVARDASAYGHDWSQRGWFMEAVGRRKIVSTDIYRSSATGDFCFTVSAPVLGPAGEVIGVLGADVNFRRLLEQ